MDRTCNICFERCKYPATNNLYCDCKYIVHYKCIIKWYNLKGTCMICNESCEKPTFSFRNNLSIEDRNNIDTYNHNLNHYDDTTIIINTRSPIDQLYENYTNYIVNRLDNLPFDNENELKTIFFAGLFYFVIYLFYIFYT